MRQLFWKEWHELCLLPLAAVACVAVLLGVVREYSHSYGNGQVFQLGDAVPALGMTWALFSLIIGAGLFSQEVGSGGLVFLSALPISRRRLWWIKSSVALAVLLLSLLASGITWRLLVSALLSAQAVRSVWAAYFSPTQEVWAALVLLGIFAASLAASPFLDRTVSAVLAATLVFAVCYGVQDFWANSYLTHHLQLYTSHSDGAGSDMVIVPPWFSYDRLVDICLALPVSVLLAVSYWTFTRGESLRSPKRFRVGTLTGAVSLGIAALIFWGGSWAGCW